MADQHVILENSIPEPNSGCWLWTGGMSSSKSGRVLRPILHVYIAGARKTVYAHRAAYEAFIGPIPPGLCVCHTCDMPPCVNPDHLFIGTNDDNVADKVQKGRQTKGEQVWKAKLTADDVLRLRRLYSLGWTRQELSQFFGIAKPTVNNILRGYRWAHL